MLFSENYLEKYFVFLFLSPLNVFNWNRLSKVSTDVDVCLINQRLDGLQNRRTAANRHSKKSNRIERATQSRQKKREKEKKTEENRCKKDEITRNHCMYAI